MKTAFKRLVNLIPQRGRLVAFDGSENVTECVARAFCNVERYGFAATSHWQLRNLYHEGSTSHWQLLRTGQPFATLTLPLAGEHNALNASAAAALAAGQGIPASSIEEAIRTFRSVKRRLEIRAEINGITVIDDFAHHPTAIRETLRALRESYGNRRLWAILEPRSNTLRRNVFELALVDSLSLADRIILAGVFKSENIPLADRLTPENVVAKLQLRNIDARTLPDADAIVASIAPELASGDVVAILSNGGFGNIYEKLPAAITAGRKL